MKTIRSISSTADLLGVLHALIESGYWSQKDISAWATEMVSRTDTPVCWLMDLVIIENSGKLEHVLSKALRDTQTRLPEWSPSLSVGFIMMRYVDGQIAEDRVRVLIAELTDPDPVLGITIEDVDNLSLTDKRLHDLSQEAMALLNQVLAFPRF